MPRTATFTAASAEQLVRARAVHWACAENRRWYRAERRADLFSALGLFLSWGGHGRAPSGTRYLPTGSSAEFEAQVLAIAKRRRQHRYEVVEIRAE